jgi:hypothetical protein
VGQARLGFGCSSCSEVVTDEGKVAEGVMITCDRHLDYRHRTGARGNIRKTRMIGSRRRLVVHVNVLNNMYSVDGEIDFVHMGRESLSSVRWLIVRGLLRELSR